MPRPSTDSRERLLAAAKSLLADKGLGGLSVRAVAAKAGVNLGLVSYHFGGKDALVRESLQSVYEDFFAELSFQVGKEKDALDALRAGLLKMARFSRDRRTLIRSLARDLMDGRPQARAFVRGNLPRHGKVLVGLFQRCMREGRLQKRPLPLVASFAIGSLAGPNLMADLMGELAPQLPFNLGRKLIEKEVLSDAALERRVDLLLKALKP